MAAKKKIIIITIALAVLAAIIGFSVNARRKDTVGVETGQVERKAELISIVTATGEIKPKEYVELQAEISGVITDLLVKEGDRVEKGSLLLHIDPIQTKAEVTAQEAVLASTESEARNQKAGIAVQETNVQRDEAGVRVAEVELRKAQQNYELRNRIFERKQELYEDNLISKDDYELVKNDVINAESALAQAEVSLEQAHSQLAVSQVVLQQAQTSYESAISRVAQQKAFLERSQDLLSKTTIRSPLAGVITQLNVEVGERAVPGTLNNPAATLMVIADLSVIEAEVEVDETDIVDLEMGQKAVVKVDALPDNPLDGIVTEIGNSAIQAVGQTQEAKDFKVVIQLAEPPASLRPGLSCTAEITTRTRADVLTIPIQALTVREFSQDENGALVRDDDKKKTATEEEEKESTNDQKLEKKEFEGVFVLTDGKAVFTEVKTGIVGESNIEVVEGLEEDQTIVTGSYKTLRTLKDGDPVKAEEKQGG
ncbi:MAG: efflux RND transporter periplasmic adaptor subunit [Acidobacteriota bacterium]|nr:MAG: efflux RND transporter periplasmic adaptor subunit [Acidobacteriota bacterium]